MSDFSERNMPKNTSATSMGIYVLNLARVQVLDINAHMFHKIFKVSIFLKSTQ